MPHQFLLQSKYLEPAHWYPILHAIDILVTLWLILSHHHTLYPHMSIGGILAYHIKATIHHPIPPNVAIVMLFLARLMISGTCQADNA